eukprot:4746394-Pyramimonas_sp.AAC.1
MDRTRPVCEGEDDWPDDLPPPEQAGNSGVISGRSSRRHHPSIRCPHQKPRSPVLPPHYHGL